MRYQREVETLLAKWREVEAKLRDVPPRSDEAAVLADEAAFLRAAYQRLTAEVREQQRPHAPAWPEWPEPEPTALQ
jgi:hypothetical protein